MCWGVIADVSKEAVMSKPRKSQLGEPVNDPELEALISAKVTGKTISEEQVRRQKVSFVYGNAPSTSKTTRESAQRAVDNVLLTVRT